MKPTTKFLSAAALLVSTSLASAQAEEHVNPTFTNRVDTALREACPDPTPSLDDPNLKACADEIYKQAYNVAANLSTFLQERTPRSLITGIAQGELLTCETNAEIMSETTFNPENPRLYARLAMKTATKCIRSTDRAESLLRIFVDTPAQNHVIDAINCFRNPEDCKRPTIVELRL